MCGKRAKDGTYFILDLLLLVHLFHDLYCLSKLLGGLRLDFKANLWRI